MAGIIYTKYKGTIILHTIISGEKVDFYTPIWIMEDVIEGKRNFGHFNPKSDMKEAKRVKYGR